MLLAGDRVTVYRNPVTVGNEEGDAILVERIRPDAGDGFSIWLVEFDDEPGEVYQRTIKERT